MAEAVQVGSKFRIPKATVLLLNNEVVSVDSPLDLAQILIEAYEHPAEDEIAPDPNLARIGYQHLVLPLVVGEDTIELKLELSTETCGYRWREFGGPEISGEPVSSYFWRKPACPVLQLPTNGRETSELLQAVANGSAIAKVAYSSMSAGVNSYDNFVMLDLAPAYGCIAEGKLWMLEDNGQGDMERILFEWEGGYSEEGRGDHVGAGMYFD